MSLWISIAVSLFPSSPALVRAEDRVSYAALSKLIQHAVIENLAREYEDRSGWGGTAPVDPYLRLQGLRMRVNVNGRDEWPHGAWKRTKLWMDDPRKDLRVEVLDLKKLDNGKARLRVAATAAGHVEHERRRWRNGILLYNLVSYADGTVTATLDCDISVKLHSISISPVLAIEPKVVSCQLELQDFALRQLGPVAGDTVRELGNELRGMVTELVRSYEPKAQELANRAIAKALQDGKGNISADVLVRALLPPRKTTR